MNERQRHLEPSQHPRPAAQSDTITDGLRQARASAEELLRAADEAIARALSSDSVQFLEATRQSGGQ